MKNAEQDKIAGIIERVTSREGLELVHWELIGPRNNSVLRIYIDKPGGVNHGDCQLVSDQVGLLLDVEDVISHQYVLEVSSPGIERGLYKPADYERFSGNKVKLKTSEPINEQRNFRGKLLGIENDVVKLDVEKVGEIEIPYEKISKANIEYEF